MNVLHRLTMLLARWFDDVALAVMAIGGVIRSKRRFELVEREDLEFLLQALGRRSAPCALGRPLRFVDGGFVEDGGARVHPRLEGGQIELVLAPRRFVFRTLELPQQASDFLDAIVRSQIDRLTPWSASQAAFGCGAPRETAPGRIGVVVAATARSSIMPFVTGLDALKPDSIVVSAASEGEGDGGQARTVVFSQQVNRELARRRVRRFLIAAPAAAGSAALIAFAAWMFVGAGLEASELQVSRQLAERRVALLSRRPGIAGEATARLAQKKRDEAATVIVLEELSQALPDDTYLTELDVADGKLEITGVTREAASLIRIIEQTDGFKHATFFAPTTRAPTGAGEQFHIQARIVPYFPTFR